MRARGPRLSLFDMLLRLGGLSGDPPLSLFHMLLRLGVLSGSPPLSLFKYASLNKRGFENLMFPL